MARTIAIVEDEQAIRENYTEAFTRQGYAVNAYTSREQAMEQFRIRLPDLVVLDIALEDDVDAGFEMCRELRTASKALPIIFLTARDSDFDAISGLRLGADDYLTKDTSIPQTLARISTLFRRVEALRASNDEHDVRHVGKLSIDVDRVQVRWDSYSVELTLTEFWIVNALAKRPGHVKTREQLMDDAKVFVDDTTITSHIKRIRKKFKAIDDDFDCIETVYGMGYRWVT
ncbi:MAG: proteobacterial dedicated sortase system response regulator [Gammaproteobacteria bacterium]